LKAGPPVFGDLDVFDGQEPVSDGGFLGHDIGAGEVSAPVVGEFVESGVGDFVEQGLIPRAADKEW
jgi:hypothetical protein